MTMQTFAPGPQALPAEANAGGRVLIGDYQARSVSVRPGVRWA
jgi:hypothetical protein